MLHKCDLYKSSSNSYDELSYHIKTESQWGNVQLVTRFRPYRCLAWCILLLKISTHLVCMYVYRIEPIPIRGLKCQFIRDNDKKIFILKEVFEIPASLININIWLLQARLFKFKYKTIDNKEFIESNEVAQPLLKEPTISDSTQNVSQPISIFTQYSFVSNNNLKQD